MTLREKQQLKEILLTVVILVIATFFVAFAFVAGISLATKLFA
jgi:hypothetical protein